MTSIRRWLKESQQHLSGSVQRQLLSHVLNKDAAWIIAHDDEQLSTHQYKQLSTLQSQIVDGVPLAYLLGHQPFWDLKLTVNEHTLIPRPDTELIIETVLSAAIQPKRILDLGTGSGALALVLAREYPDSFVTATDLSPDALEVAKQNARTYQIDNIEFLQSHWFTQVTYHDYDLIVSNPPYIEPTDRHLKDLSHEPIAALVAENKGLADLTAIINNANRYLKVDGLLIVEHGYDQQQPVTELMHQAGLTRIKNLHDIEQRPRATMGHSSLD